VAGEGDGAAVDHRRSRSVSVTTIHARPNAVTVAERDADHDGQPELATAAHTAATARRVVRPGDAVGHLERHARGDVPGCVVLSAALWQSYATRPARARRPPGRPARPSER
jgi:hypothetical protein